MSEPIKLSENESIRATEFLESICKGNESREVRLPSGGSVLISPFDGLAALADALDTPEVRSVLRECAAEFAAGEIEPFEIEPAPTRDVTGKKKVKSKTQTKAKAASKRGRR